jgi:hypothetical protein
MRSHRPTRSARPASTAAPQLAAALLDRAHRLGIRVAFVAGDEVYGGRELRCRIRQCGMGYVVAGRANHIVTVPVLDVRASPAVPADRRRGRPLAHRGRPPARQAEHRPRRRAGHPLEVLAPLDHTLPARLHLPRCRYRPAAPAGHQLRTGRRTDPDHRPGTATAPARHRHPAAPPGPSPSDALYSCRINGSLEMAAASGRDEAYPAVDFEISGRFTGPDDL